MPVRASPAVATAPIVFGERTPLLGMLTSPARRSEKSGVVVCAPFGHEGTRAYRPLRTLAERLARDGRPVLRFDWPCSGDSGELEFEDATTWTRTVHEAVRALRECTGVEEVALVGLRIGGTIAVLAALDDPSVVELVLLAPFDRGTAYLDDVRAYEDTHSHLYRDPDGVASLPAGAVLASGFVVTPEEVQELEALDLPAEDLSRTSLRGALVVGAEDDDSSRAVVDALARSGADAAHVVCPELSRVWDGTNVSVLPRECERVVRSWLGRPRDRTRKPAHAPGRTRMSVGEGVVEEALTFDTRRGRRFAIACESAEGEGPDDTWVLFLNAGRVRRSGPNRLWTTYARAWARTGLPSLRLDVWGTGDSDGSPLLDELQVHIRSQYFPAMVGEDIAGAFRWLSDERGARRFALVGMCSTAYWAFRTALADSRVVAQALVNVPTLYWDGRSTLLEPRQTLRDLRLIARTPRLWHHAARAGARPPLREVADNVLGLAGRDRRRHYHPGLFEAFEELSKRGTDTLLVFSEGDRGIRYVERYVGEDFSDLLARYGVTTEIVSGPDHTFRPLWSHDVLRRILEAQLQHVGFLREHDAISAEAGARRMLG